MTAPRFSSFRLTTVRAAGCLALAIGVAAGAARADYRLNILHINDLRSRIEPISKYDGTCAAEDDEAGECFGGVARLKTFFDERRTALAQENVISLSAGDEFQGSLFYTTYKGAAAAEFMNDIGFDAVVVGNHEFDDGPEALARFVDMAAFPVIAGNLSAYGEPLLKGEIPGYVILDVGGEKIGVVGVVTSETAELSSPGPTVGFADDIRYLTSIIPEIEDQGVNKIVVLSHVGLPRDKEIAATVQGVDVIVGGHSHTYLSADDEARQGPYPTWVSSPEGALVPVVQAGAYSKYVGELSVEFDDAGEVIFAEGNTHLIDASVAKDQAVDARVRELGGPIRETMAEAVGETTAPIDGSRTSCRSGECEMGALVADALLDATADQGAEIAILNGGGLRASIDEGEVTMGEVLAVLPFQNTVSTFRLAGADVIAALENGVSQVGEGGGRFPQVAGMRYAFDASAPVGERIAEVEVKTANGYAPLDPGATYGVVSNNFMRAGGDGYSVFETGAIDPYDFGPGLEEVVAAYLAETAPYAPTLHGNVVAGRSFDAAAAPEPATPVEEPAGSEEPIVSVEPAEADAPAAKIYIVRADDTLWDIAKAQLGDATLYTRIAELNGLASAAAISIGQELTLPR